MQVRVNDANVNKIPKFLASNPTNETHSIIVTYTDDPEKLVILPLAIRGVNTYLPNRPITKEEWESGSYPRL